MTFLSIVAALAAGFVVFFITAFVINFILTVFNRTFRRNLVDKEPKGIPVVLTFAVSLYIGVQVGGWVRSHVSGEAQYIPSMDAVNVVQHGKHLPVSTRMIGILVAEQSYTNDEYQLHFDRGSTMSIPEACRTPPGEIPEFIIIIYVNKHEEGYCYGACGFLHKYIVTFTVSLLNMKTGGIDASLDNGTGTADYSGQFDEYYNSIEQTAEQRSCPPSAKPKGQEP